MISQLLLSKRLYTIGSDYASRSDPVSAGTAISMFQDSVEILCWSILKELDIQVKDTAQFTSFFGLIENSENNVDAKKLPFKAKLLEMNKARVNFKHYGNLPDVSEAKKFKGYTEEFLRLSFNVFFKSDFDSISLAQLIPSDGVRSAVENAENYLSEGQLLEASQQLAIAKNRLFQKFSEILPTVDRNIKEFDNILAQAAGYKGFTGYHGIRAFAYVYEYLDRMRDFNIASLCEISMQEYALMKSILPSAYQTGDGKWHYTAASSKPSQDSLNTVIDLITSCALKLYKHN